VDSSESGEKILHFVFEKRDRCSYSRSTWLLWR